MSDFLNGLGSHLTDIEPVEILTLAPLGGLVVIFGLQPGLLLNVFGGTVRETLDAVRVAADRGPEPRRDRAARARRAPGSSAGSAGPSRDRAPIRRPASSPIARPAS